MTQNRSEGLQIALGLAVLVVLGVIVYYVALAPLSRLIFPGPEPGNASIAMAAYFDSTANGLRVAGTVLENGKPLAEGRARVTVRRLNDASQQSVSLVIKEGRFESGEQAAFSNYAGTDRLNVRTDVSKPETALLTTEELY